MAHIEICVCTGRPTPFALNIGEGYGMFHYMENKNFCYYSRGSAKETLPATTKAKTRKLISGEEFTLLSQKLTGYSRLMYGYINSIGTQKLMNNL